MKNKINKFVAMLGPFSPWLLIPGLFSLYGIVAQNWSNAVINGLIVVASLGYNYHQNRKLLVR